MSNFKKPTRFFVPDEKASLRQRFQAPPEISKMLPVNTGYDGDAFAEDIYYSFRDDVEMQDLHDIAEDWETQVRFSGRSKKQEWGTNITADEAPSSAAFFYKNHSRFRHSQLRNSFLDLAGNNPEVAAKAFMSWLAWHMKNAADQTTDNFEKTMKEFRRMQHQFPPIGGEEINPEMVAKMMRIAELIPRVQRRYDFTARKKVGHEPVHHPEDSIDIRPIRHVTEFMKVGPSAQAMSDDEFYMRLVRNQLLVPEHFKDVPRPMEFVMYLDVSGSMQDCLRDGYSRAEYSVACAIALLTAADTGGNKATLHRFDAGVQKAYSGDCKEVIRELWKCTFSGGGTSFRAVLKHLNANYEKAECAFIITDGGSGTGDLKPSVPLHTLLVGMDIGDGGGGCGDPNCTSCGAGPTSSSGVPYAGGLGPISVRVEVVA